MGKSAIEWTESTWNPVTGCTKISPGCEHCYAELLSKRLKAMGNPKYARGFQVTLHQDYIDEPLHWKTPQIIFVNSMSDLFHENVPDDFIIQVFNVMRKAKWHKFQVLTKRSDRLLQLSPFLPWSPNIWMGVSVETMDYTFRIEHLREVGAQLKFLSLEPLLGDLNLDLTGIDWVIVGGESGHKARAMASAWAINIRNQCTAAQVPFFFKQWGGFHKKKNGRQLEGRTWDEVPDYWGAFQSAYCHP